MIFPYNHFVVVHQLLCKYSLVMLLCYAYSCLLPVETLVPGIHLCYDLELCHSRICPAGNLERFHHCTDQATAHTGGQCCNGVGRISDHCLPKALYLLYICALCCISKTVSKVFAYIPIPISTSIVKPSKAFLHESLYFIAFTVW